MQTDQPQTELSPIPQPVLDAEAAWRTALDARRTLQTAWMKAQSKANVAKMDEIAPKLTVAINEVERTYAVKESVKRSLILSGGVH